MGKTETETIGIGKGEIQMTFGTGFVILEEPMWAGRITVMTDEMHEIVEAFIARHGRRLRAGGTDGNHRTVGQG